MTKIDFCPSCNGEARFLAHGVIAPWLVELCTIRQDLTSLCRCDECELVFFSYRYTEKELTDLYADYRSDSFYKLRHSWEPWYNSSVNEAFSERRTNDNQINDRREFTLRNLETAGVKIDGLSGCIDFGGDHGQFIPSGITGKAYVVEKGSSQKQSEGGTIFVDSIEDVSESVDLVLNCYVLEHLPFIDDVLQKMRLKLSPSGFMHFEVPLDMFAVSRFHRSRFYRRYLQYLVRRKRLFTAIDLFTGIYRHIFRRIVWCGIVKQSEHINYFSRESLVHFLESRGGEIVHISDSDYRYKVGSVRQGRLACVVR